MDSTPAITQSPPLAGPAAARLSFAPSPSLSLLPPPLPQRDTRRNSYILEALLTHTTTKAAATTFTTMTDVASSPTPHDIYLSSEEDASSMGDLSDLSDFEDDLDDGLFVMDDKDINVTFTVELARTASIVMRTNSTASLASATTYLTTAAASTPPAPIEKTASSSIHTHSRHSSHDTARAVAVVFAGKPSLIELGVGRDTCRRSHGCCERTLPVELPETRPVAHSTDVSPASQLRRDSLSSSTVASFCTRQPAMTAFTAANLETLAQSSGPVLTVLDSCPSPPPPTATHSFISEPIAPSSYTYTASSPTTLLPATDYAAAAPRRSFTTSLLISPLSSSSANSSSRAPTLGSGTGSLLRGVTRSLTLSSRRGMGHRASSVMDKSGISAAPPASLTASLPSENDLTLETSSASSFGNRMSMAISVVSAMTLMTPPPSRPHKDASRSENDAIQATAMPCQRPMTPAASVVSKKSAGGTFLGSLTSRRRSMKLL
ncbi:hypothetical protein SEPCBS57363_003525 [Sporothrix epigloea]|uniref:Uncharacterized protein n=1 Tax=Sporothrix epigloea TaxID=1892477 RepID=A0ABP0DLZ6_9PEZI